jgi:hypothetical protein
MNELIDLFIIQIYTKYTDAAVILNIPDVLHMPMPRTFSLVKFKNMKIRLEYTMNNLLILFNVWSEEK